MNCLTKMVVLLMQLSSNLGIWVFFWVWRVHVGNYKIHGEDMALPSQIPSITSRLSTFKHEKQQSIKVTTKPFDFHIVFNLTNNTYDEGICVCHSYPTYLCKLST
jgi:hypothetical protein